MVARWGMITAAPITSIKPGRDHERAVTPLRFVASSRHGPLPPPLLCSPSGLLLITKPQPRSSPAPCSTCARYVSHSPEVQITRHLFAGQPCYACSRAKELWGQASPPQTQHRVLSHTGAARASFPGASEEPGESVPSGLRLDALQRPFPALVLFFLLRCCLLGHPAQQDPAMPAVSAGGFGALCLQAVVPGGACG